VPIVVTQGKVDDALLALLERYNAALVHSRLAGSGGGLARLDAKFGWRVVTGRGRNQVLLGSSDQQPFTAPLLRAAAGRELPEEVSRTLPGDELATYLTAGIDLAQLRELLTTLEGTLAQQHNRDALTAVMRRAPLNKPYLMRGALVELATTHHMTDFGFDYLQAPAGGHVAAIVKPLVDGTDVPASTLANLAEGVAGQEAGVTVLRAIDHVLNGRYDLAAAYVQEHKGTLTGPEKTNWVIEFNNIIDANERQRDELFQLSQLVVDCWT
jgi:hypothetical protein